MPNQIISIVLPVYNGSEYLPQAIENCLMQSYRDLELIIVDDCSTDNSLEIANSYAYADSRVKVVRHNQNKKLPAALNSGFSEATGEFLTWTSHDNYHAVNALETLWAYLANHPEVDVVYSDFYLINQSGVVTGEVKLPTADHLIYRNIVGASFLYRRIVHDRIGKYDEDLFLSEDYDFWLRASLVFKFAHIEEKLYYYRNHSETLTAQQFERVFLSIEKTLAKFVRENDTLDKSTVIKINYNLIRLAYDYQNYEKTVLYFLKSMKSAPLETVVTLLTNRQDFKLLLTAYRKSQG